MARFRVDSDTSRVLWVCILARVHAVFAESFAQYSGGVPPAWQTGGFLHAIYMLHAAMVLANSSSTSAPTRRAAHLTPLALILVDAELMD